MIEEHGPSPHYHVTKFSGNLFSLNINLLFIFEHLQWANENCINLEFYITLMSVISLSIIQYKSAFYIQKEFLERE